MAPVAALGGGADDAVEADDIRGQPRHGHGTQEIFWILKMNLKLMN